MTAHPKLLVAMMVLSMVCSGRAAELRVGAEVTAIVPATGKRVVVYLPADYDAGRRWPVVFHFHGANGRNVPTHDRQT